MSNQIPQLTPEEQERLGNLLLSALTSWANDDREKSIKCMSELGEIAGKIPTLFMLAGFIVGSDNPNSGEMLGFELVDAKGNVGNPDELFTDPTSHEAAITWCARFVVASANGQIEQCKALIAVTPSQDAAEANMFAMLNIAGEMMRGQLGL